ncbi:hypothetical protein PPSIR1_21709 [Plesiocystis pacifica SIR-1]|uniref:Amphi-Trp domain-containing protein n=1 Tax=Plesiocystis pacifica SIR-1 TaxID=391625 RepID=A6FXI9_9BACT|nr:amphi-Trp domain-containing protein [Plesiocystis pacifica]EDM81577.1 hypothetical protein PPSIR1_21709 [Plesiocystis pacifica SIR-1]
MTDETETSTETPATTDAPPADGASDAEPSPEPVADDDTAVIEVRPDVSDEDGEGDDDSDAEEADSDDDDEKSKKADKPKKVKINFEASMPRGEAVSYFDAIVGGLKSGRLEFRQDGDVLVLNPPEQLEIEVKASRKSDKGKVVFEIEWSDENRPLEILN